MSALTWKNIDTSEITVVKKMRDYSNEPVFKKKLERAKAFLKKAGLPKSFSKKK